MTATLVRPDAAISDRAADTAGCLALVGAGLILSLPVFQGDVLSAADNPVHVSEIVELARPGFSGWSELGFAGFPLGLLQPPLTFRGLALLSRFGLLELGYRFAIVLAVIAPALAFYAVARKRVGPVAAFMGAAPLILYRVMAFGEASAYAGMFSFYIASAAFVLLLEILSRPRRDLRTVGTIALLSGFIATTHMYVTIGLAYLSLIHLASSALRTTARSKLFYDLPGLGLGAMASACYWLPNMLARTSSARGRDPLMRVLTRLVTASPPNAVPSEAGVAARLLQDPLLHADALLQLVIVVLFVLQARAVWRERDELPRYGVLLAVVIYGAMVLSSLTGVPLLGPTGTRLCYLAKVGMLLTCLPTFERLVARSSRSWVLGGVCAASLLLATTQLRHVVADLVLPGRSADRADAEALWMWLRSHDTHDWGRVYVQDTFGDRRAGILQRGHVLVRTAEKTGVEQVGAYYGLTPYERAWMAVDVNETSADTLLQVFKRLNVTHAIVAGFGSRADVPFRRLATFGRLSLLELATASADWAQIKGGTGAVSVERVRAGLMRVAISGAPTEIAVSEAFHPFWRVLPEGSARLTADDMGLMTLGPVVGAASPLELAYQPPRIPSYLSACGALLTLIFLLLGRRLDRSGATH